MIDGFYLTGSLAGGGVYIYGDVQDFEVSNNTIRSNQGNLGGGITIGDVATQQTNFGIRIHHNRIVKNGGVRGGGGVSIYDGSHNYEVTDNVISGNLSRFYGGGVLHYGLSDTGLIARNQILFNEVFWGNQIGGDGGGIYIGAVAEAGLGLFEGTGNVTIDSNRIQGNLSGSGNGGGIAAARVNGVDVDNLPQNLWYRLDILNNVISNNVAATAGAGIWLSDVAAASILHNTVSNNDSTATSANSFNPGNTVTSNPQVAGIASELHTADLQAAFPIGLEQTYADPVLANNIVWQNRSFFWDATENNNKGGLVASTPAVSDLGVLSANPADVLHPLNSVLTDPAGTDPSNVASDPAFQSSVVNALETAAVIDEGGNFITVRYTPLNAPQDSYTLGDMSGATGVADPSWIAQYVPLASDFQGDPRLEDGLVEAGADELLSGDANCDGIIDADDVVQILSVIFGGASVCGNEDVNFDGVVDAADLAMAVNQAN